MNKMNFTETPVFNANDSDITGASVGGDSYTFKETQAAGQITELLAPIINVPTPEPAIYQPQTPRTAFQGSPSGSQDFVVKPLK